MCREKIDELECISDYADNFVQFLKDDFEACAHSMEIEIDTAYQCDETNKQKLLSNVENDKNQFNEFIHNPTSLYDNELKCGAPYKVEELINSFKSAAVNAKEFLFKANCILSQVKQHLSLNYVANEHFQSNDNKNLLGHFIKRYYGYEKKVKQPVTIQNNDFQLCHQFDLNIATLANTYAPDSEFVKCIRYDKLLLNLANNRELTLRSQDGSQLKYIKNHGNPKGEIKMCACSHQFLYLVTLEPENAHPALAYCIKMYDFEFKLIIEKQITNESGLVLRNLNVNFKLLSLCCGLGQLYFCYKDKNTVYSIKINRFSLEDLNQVGSL